ncbi:hypothetical protein ABGT15_11200 [Flavobacterium enshiense]|uniref:hypothetical protein n=1 Tax=Flavobacterium enshiense TaxID=1341165 RepID=UPI00345D3C3E
MKTATTCFYALLLFLFLFPLSSFAQEKKMYYLTVTTAHRNFAVENPKFDEWLALEKEYFEKVVKKNEFIIGHNVLNHYFTADNSEIIFVNVYENWDAIDKAWTKNQDLVKQAWPDENARKAFFEKRNKYYVPNHSDEIYVTYGDRKGLAKAPEKPMVYYVRKSIFATPKDGTGKEFDECNKELFDNLAMKNDVLKAYYAYNHAWGSNNMEFVEVFVVDALGDLEKAWDKDDELFKAKWKDEKAREAFSKKYDKYFTGQHADYVYRSVPELLKMVSKK